MWNRGFEHFSKHLGRRANILFINFCFILIFFSRNAWSADCGSNSSSSGRASAPYAAQQGTLQSVGHRQQPGSRHSQHYTHEHAVQGEYQTSERRLTRKNLFFRLELNQWEHITLYLFLICHIVRLNCNLRPNNL